MSGEPGPVEAGQDAHDLSGLLSDQHDAAESKHRRTAKFLQAIVDNTTDAVMLVDRDGIFTFVSHAITDVTGHQPEDLVGTLCFDIVHPDDLEIAAQALEILRVDGEQSNMQARVRRAGGGWTWVEVLGGNRLGDPDLDSMILSVRNVTDRLEVTHRLEAVLRTITGAVLTVDGDRRVRWRSPGAEHLVGNHTRLDRRALLALLDESDATAADSLFDEVLAAGPGARRRMVTRLGVAPERTWVELSIDSAFDDKTVGGLIVNVRDIDRQVRTERAGARLSEVLEASTDLVLLLDADLHLLWANQSAQRLLPSIGMGEPLAKVTPRWVSAVMRRETIPALETTGVWRGEIAFSTDGVEVPIEATYLSHADPYGRVEFISAIGRDMTERHALEQRLHAQARHDPLTGLPNRTLLMEHLHRRLEQSTARLAIVFCDVDEFKVVNDSRGHDVGDRLLVTVSERLQASLRADDLVARFGGDEFVIVLDDVHGIDHARELAERLVQQARGPARAAELEVFVTLSAGVAVGRDGIDAATVIAEADAAMYQAKARGRDRIEVYDADLRASTRRRLETAHELRLAIEQGLLEVWLQPIVETGSGRPVAVEALTRWVHPERGVIGPDEFIGVAEQTGLVVELGFETMRATLAAAREFADRGTVLPFSINLSARQLTEPTLLSTLASLTDEYGVDPSQLLVEITESTAMHDVELTTRNLDALRDLGVRVVIDDFGTGYSSLAYLHRFPVDLLKIDRSFVADLSFDMDWQRSLVAGIISLCQSLGIRVVGEGVERKEQAQILERLGCDFLQGFHFGPPLPKAAARAALLSLGAPTSNRR